MGRVRLARIAHAIAKPNGATRPLVALDNIDGFGGKLVNQDDLPWIDMGAGFAFEPGDVLIGKIRPYLGKNWIATFAGACISSICVVRTDPAQLEPRYLGYLTRSRSFIDFLVARSVGVTMPVINWGDIRDFEFDCPSLRDQRRVVTYLDAATRAIDDGLVLVARLAALLERRLAQEIEEGTWGEVMQRLPLRRVAKFVDYRGATPVTSTGGVPLVTASNVRSGEIDLELRREFLADDVYWAWMRRGWPQPGDLVITTEAPLGEVGMIRDAHLALAQRLILLKLDRTRVEPEYLGLALRASSFQRQLLANASGSTAVGIRADRLRQLLVPAPELAYQRAVVDRLSMKSRDTAAALGLLEREARLLRERRDALIAEALVAGVGEEVAA